MAANVLGKVYETLLCSPGMNEAVKIDVKVSRKAVLLLSSIIDHSIGGDGTSANELLSLVPSEDLEELKDLSADSLKKAGLTDLNEKIKGLQVK